MNQDESSSSKYQSLSSVQRKLFLEIAGYPYQGDEHKGQFKTDRPYNKSWDKSPWIFSFKFQPDTGYLFCELLHRMTNNRTYGWDYQGNPLPQHLIDEIYRPGP